jgi:hypothetical protein
VLSFWTPPLNREGAARSDELPRPTDERDTL